MPCPRLYAGGTADHPPNLPARCSHPSQLLGHRTTRRSGVPRPRVQAAGTPARDRRPCLVTAHVRPAATLRTLPKPPSPGSWGTTKPSPPSGASQASRAGHADLMLAAPRKVLLPPLPGTRSHHDLTLVLAPARPACPFSLRHAGAEPVRRAASALPCRGAVPVDHTAPCPPQRVGQGGQELLGHPSSLAHQGCPKPRSDTLGPGVSWGWPAAMHPLAQGSPLFSCREGSWA